MSSVHSILTDIEGTTTSIAFVHEVLFPLAARELPGFISENWNGTLVKNEIEALKRFISEEKHIQISEVTVTDVVGRLTEYIRIDKKDTTLKSIQGKIWKTAYESGKVKGHVYDDVLPAFKRWKEQGLSINIYSSGSVEAQKLIYGYSTSGDLTVFIDQYFDTRIGSKKEQASYDKIAKALQCAPEQVLFLSDIVSELDAASNAGMQTIQLIRHETSEEVTSGHEVANDFQGILV